MATERLIALGLGLLLPGLGTTVFEVVTTLRDVASTVRGNRLKCAHVVERVEFLYSELARIQDANVLEGNAVLPELAKVINAFVLFMREHAAKRALSQYFARHDVDARILTFHSDVDMLFQMLNMVHIAAAAEWRVRFQENQERDRRSIEETLANTHLLLAEYRGRGLMEALMAVQFAIQNANGPNNTRQLTQADVALLQRTLVAMAAQANVALETLPPWYVPSGDVTFESDSFAVGTFGSVHYGKWNGTAVVVKQLLLVSEQAEQSFLTEATIWHTLNHPHIVRLYGACHKSTPLFFVCDHAPHGNFVDFFRGEKGTERVQEQLWQRFYEAALGLEYLHTQKRVVHGDLKCNNLLVGEKGTAKLCDFGFSFIRSESKALSKKAQTDAIRWKALECIEDGTHSERNPLFQSDVYALGMCIIEAASGETPWNGCDDATIYKRLLGGHGHKRPDGCFTDDQWRVVAHMTAIKAVERIPLKDALVELRRLADEEKEAVERSATARHECPRCHFVTTGQECSQCHFVAIGHVNYCSHCGAAFQNKG